MKDAKAKLTKAGRTLDGKLELTLCFDTDQELSGLDGDLSVTIKPYSKRRSLDANAYAWVLIDRIAEAVRGSKADIYRQAIKDIGGVSASLVMSLDAAEAFASAWKERGIGWQTDIMPHAVDGYVNITAYYGSSVYDSAQMMQLIDCLIAEASALGIETMTPNELLRLRGYGMEVMHE